MLIAAIGVSACAAESALDAPAGKAVVHRLRYASPYAASHPFSRADLSWIEYIERASDGRIRIEPFWAGALLSSDQSMLELRHQVADIGVITPIYTRGGAHLLRAQAGFYAGARSFQTQVAVYKCLAREFPEFGRELAGLEVLAVQGGSLPSLLTRTKTVRTLADLSSLRLRAPVELTGILRKLGADPVSMPMGEVYSALSKGIIDGVVAPADALRSMHLAEVGRYFTQLEVPRGAYPARAMSTQAMRRLPEDLQALLATSGPLWEAAIERELKTGLERGTSFGRERGVQWLALPVKEQRRFDASYNRGALESAHELSRYGVDGVPIFERAQALIARIEDGDAAACPHGEREARHTIGVQGEVTFAMGTAATQARE
jgi:TRAP-type C4-dicarboxylate transport system substrate-binding protein